MTTLLQTAGFVALDFDGPVCGLFRHVDLVTATRSIAHSLGLGGITDRTDIFDLIHLSEAQPDLRALAHELLTRTEVSAARGAAITPGARELVEQLAHDRVPIAVVTNNAPEAVAAFAEAHFPHLVDVPVFGRGPTTEPRLKPAPDLLEAAMTAVCAQPGTSVFIGDSVSDIRAGQQLGVRVIGLANRPPKRDLFRTAGSDAIIDTLYELVRPDGRN